MHGDAQDILERYKRAWQARDVDAVMELYAGEAEHRDDPFHEPHQGLESIRGMWNDIAASEVNVEFDAERIWVSGRTVLASWHAAYTDVSNGDRVRLRAFTTLEIDAGGLIQRLRQWPVSRVVGQDSTYTPVRRT